MTNQDILAAHCPGLTIRRCLQPRCHGAAPDPQNHTFVKTSLIKDTLETQLRSIFTFILSLTTTNTRLASSCSFLVAPGTNGATSTRDREWATRSRGPARGHLHAEP